MSVKKIIGIAMIVPPLLFVVGMLIYLFVDHPKEAIKFLGIITAAILWLFTAFYLLESR